MTLETAPPNPPPTARSRRRVPPENRESLSSIHHPSIRRPPPMASAPAPGVVVVFDFDRTIIDWDSDDWVVTKLGAADAFQRLRPTMRWNPLMDRMMEELHARGKTVEDIRDCLRSAPLDAHVISAIKTAASLGCDLKVVSDANTFFIETVLAHHGVLGCFSEISTNPARVDADGRLRISPFHDSASAPHGCSLCPDNMCKVWTVGRWISSGIQCQISNPSLTARGQWRVQTKERSKIYPKMNRYDIIYCKIMMRSAI
uniref:Uncharacterized protein n=1 Tax=Setaria italica TaxID=4555 RepID=K3XL51_SETIT